MVVCARRRLWWSAAIQVQSGSDGSGSSGPAPEVLRPTYQATPHRSIFSGLDSLPAGNPDANPAAPFGALQASQVRSCNPIYKAIILYLDLYFNIHFLIAISWRVARKCAHAPGRRIWHTAGLCCVPIYLTITVACCMSKWAQCHVFLYHIM